MKTGILYGDRYFKDVNESGLIYDLYPLSRGAGDESVFNERIAVANGYLQDINAGWKATLLLNDNQVAGFSDEWNKIFAPKTILMLFRPGVEVGDYKVWAWTDYTNDGFLWSSPEKVYTKYDANQLSARFRIVKQQEVDDWLGTNSPPANPPAPPPEVIPPVIIPPDVIPTVAGDYHVTGKIWFMDVDLHVTREE